MRQADAGDDSPHPCGTHSLANYMSMLNSTSAHLFPRVVLRAVGAPAPGLAQGSGKAALAAGV